MRIHHIGYLVKKLEKAAEEFEKLGYVRQGEVTDDTYRKADILFLEKDGYVVELVSPNAPDSVVAGLLKTYKNAPYHICYVCEDLDGELEEGDYFGFAVDAGMGCIADVEAQKAFREYWAGRLEDDEDIDPYNDLFCDLLEESYRENPRYQREGGDWVNWTVPGTDLSIPIFASGWGDGVYPCYFGYDSDGNVSGVYILFIEIEDDSKE